MPTIGRWELIFHRSLPSLLKQTHKDWDLYIIDDASENRITYEHVKAALEAYDPRVHVITVGTKDTHYPVDSRCSWMAGPVVALNCGLAYVDPKGWVFRMDDDDTLYPDCLHTLLFNSGHADVVQAVVINGETGLPFEPYKYGGVHIGSIQGMMYRGYLKFMKYNKDCWRKKWNAVNDVELQTRLVDAGCWWAQTNTVVARVDPRPGLTTVGSKAWAQEHAE